MQTAVQITAGALAGLEILVNPLMADAHPLLPLQPGHDLLQTPGLTDQLFTVPRQGQTVGLLGPVALQAVIAR